jgi:hypothetical protein
MLNNNSEYFEGITFGSTISFNLQFSGPAIDSPSGKGSGSTFTLSLLNSNQDGSYLTSDVNEGYILRFDIDTNGRVTPTTYTTDTGAPSVVRLQVLPEPGSFALSGSAILLLVLGSSLLRRARSANA